MEGWTPKIAGFEAGVNYKNTFRIENGYLSSSYSEYDTFSNEFGHLLYSKEKFSHYSLRAKSQTSSPPRREDSDSLVSTITQACCENNTVMEVKSMKSQNRCVGKTPDKSVHENPSTPSAQSERRVKTP